MDYDRLLSDVAREVAPQVGAGAVAGYIPELAKVPIDQFGIAVFTVRGEAFGVGHADQRFSIQSISKVFALMLALQHEGEALWQRVGREPSGAPFNALFQIEGDRGKPRNPFVNAGALVVTDALCSHHAVPENAVAELLQRLAANPAVHYDRRVAASELAHCDRNAALAYLIRSFGNLRNPVDVVLGAYCRQCAIAMNCLELARAACVLAGGAASDASGLGAASARRLRALMLTCGTYDAAGDFAYRIGLPVKSGVGGGIIAVVPGECGICVWSPGLDASGNSVAGQAALELLAAALVREGVVAGA
jgi:glutaminase